MARIIGVVCCNKMLEGFAVQSVAQKYLDALVHASGCTPLLIPAMAGFPGDNLSIFDGFLFPGSLSNVHPCHYGHDDSHSVPPHDTERDNVTLPLIRSAVATGKPVLGICRGLQEINVALGGTLYPKVHDVAGRFDHRPAKDLSLIEQYALAHNIDILPDTLLSGILGTSRTRVNSLHGQGIDQLAPALVANAIADDGQIEAVSLKEPSGFLLALQWHPESHYADNPDSAAIFKAFGTAVYAA